MSSIKKFLSDTVIYGLSTIIARVLNFLLTPIFIDKFPASVYGIFTNLYSYAAMINAILAFGMETTYFRYLQRFEKAEKEKVFNNSFLITIVTVLLFLTTMFLFTHPMAAWLAEGQHITSLEEYTLFVKYFAIILAADALAVVPFAKLRAEGRPIRYSVIKIINILTLVFCNLFLLFWLPSLMKDSSFWQNIASGWYREGWLGNVFIANLVASVVTLLLLIPQIASFRLSADKDLIKSMLSYSFPILIANISFIVNEHLDKMMFPKLLPGEQGEQDLGVYGAVAKIAVFLNLFVTAFRLGAEPFFFSHAKNENARKTYAMIMDYFVLAMVLVMIGICANLDWLKHFIEGNDVAQQQIYWSGLFLVPILLLNNVLLGIYINLSVWYKLSDQTRYALYISGIGAIITIILNLLLIPSYSYIGAVVSTTITYIIMVSVSFFWGQKNYPIPYNVGKIMLYLILGAGLSFFMYFVLDSNFWVSNLLLILFLSFVIFIEKDKISTILKRK